VLTFFKTGSQWWMIRFWNGALEFDGGEDSRDGQICVMLRIFGDVFVDGVKIAHDCGDR